MDPAPPLDGTRPVRAGEELPADALARWLAGHLEAPHPSGSLEIAQFPGGHSNLTYLLRWGDRELVLRRPPVGSTVKTAHDMGREFRVLSKLAAVYPKAPRPFLHCDDPSILGAPFYLMERVRGTVLRDRRAGGLDIPPERMRALSEAAVNGLAELHRIDLDAAGLADLGRPRGYAARQVAGWGERWIAARTDDVPEIDRAFAWLGARIPAEDLPPALLHNDYKYDNLVFAPDLTRVVAVLDWEMATTGDPRMDLGYALACWIDPGDAPPLQALAFGPTAMPGNLARAEVAERYAAATGRTLEDLGDVLFFYVFGLAKLAVIAQQIYARYRRGLTRDERFARLLDGVRILGATAAKAVEKGRIDRLEA
ncbi:MAG TPA: phosphotransferase family protein [Thermoanaerobaculia bacterium]